MNKHQRPEKSDTFLVDINSEYENAVSDNGRYISTHVTEDGRTVLLENGEHLVKHKKMVFNPALSDDGKRFAVSLGEYNPQYSKIVIGNSRYGATRTLNWQTTFTVSGDVVWLSSGFTKRRPHHRLTKICREDPNGPKAICKSLDFLAARLVRLDKFIYALGFNEEERKFQISRIDLSDTGIEIKQAEFHKSALISRPGGLFKVDVTGNVGRPLWTHLYYLNEDRQNALVFGDNNFGRLSWHISNRIRVCVELVSAYNHPELTDHLNKTVEQLLLQADTTGRFPGRKYSIDRNYPLKMIVLDGLIYDALWEAYPYLSAELQSQIITYSNKAIEDMDSLWNGNEYIWDKNPHRKQTGILPFNQQNSIGIVMIKMMQLTGTEKYRPRVRKLYDNLIAEISSDDGAMTWRYWPKSHYDKSKPIPDKAEDIGHAAINIEFLIEASEFLNEKPYIDVEVLAKTIATDDFEFHRSIKGETARFLPSRYWAPSRIWGRAEVLDPFFETWIELPRANFDSSQIGMAYASKLPHEEELNGTVVVNKTFVQDDGCLRFESIYSLQFSEDGTIVKKGENSRQMDPAEAFMNVVQCME